MSDQMKDERELAMKGYALWLIENTMLTFEQIAQFCNIHYLTVQAIADSEIHVTVKNPVIDGILSEQEIQNGSKDKEYKISRLKEDATLHIQKTAQKPSKSNIKMTKLSMMGYILHYYPHIEARLIARAFHVTAKTVANVRNMLHNGEIESLVNPQDSGFMTVEEFNQLIQNM